ncbi:serine O-acetyltransferase [Leptolyngbyaceae cyanobacterium UHCC 1019]
MEKQSGFAEALKAWSTMVDELKADIDRYVLLNSSHWFVAVLGTKGIWASTQYRVSRWVHYYFHFPVIRLVLKLLCFVSQKVMETIAGSEVPNRAKIGKGILMPHTNGIVIHIDAELGDYCNVSQQVTIGIGGRGETRGTPKIGDRVFIGPGAKIFGAITIGNDVAIGANAVVTKDLPDNAVAVGIPAKVISYEGSQDFVIYRKELDQIDQSV